MSLMARLDDDLKQALKGGDKLRVSGIRMLKARIQERLVAARAKEGPDARLDDAAILDVIAAYAKQRRDSIDSYREGGRDDLARREEAELEIVARYLPAQMSEEEVRQVVREAIAEAGATSPRDLGAVMKLAMPRVKGSADGKLVNRLARELLTPSD
jgi:uncharacterized protein YqeY